jgi:hypothetical protein
MKSELLHISFIKMYEFKGWKFDYDRLKPFGPWPLKKDLEPRVRAGKKFYSMFDKFLELPVKEQEKLRI